jgi:nucleoid DNA-binding protein
MGGKCRPTTRECIVPWCQGIAMSENGKGYCAKHTQQINSWGEIRHTPEDPFNEIFIYKNEAYIRFYDRIGNLKSEVCVIDSEDVEKVKNIKWRITHGYCSSRKLGVSIQNIILGVETSFKMVVDHIDGNKLNNKKVNLRYCKFKENLRNKRVQSNNKSGYAGVWFEPSKNWWRSYIKVDGKVINLGYHYLKTEAILAREKAEIEYFGEFRYGKRQSG